MKRKPAIKIIRIILCSILYVFFLTALISNETIPVSGKWILFSGGMIVLAILDIYFMRETNPEAKKLYRMLNGLTLLCFVGTVLLSLANLDQSSGKGCRSNHVYAASYVNAIGTTGYYNLDEAVFSENSAIDKAASEIYRYQKGNYSIVFFCDSQKIITKEYLIEQEKYYYIGQRKLIFDSDWVEHNCTDAETMKADIAEALSMMEIIKDSLTVFPVWGVSEDEKVEDVTVNGKKISTIKELTGETGEKFYFWMVEDIGKNRAVSEVEILRHNP